jgi:hypothetical protein
MSDEFAGPAASAGFDYEAALGHLLVVTVKDYEESITTMLGDKPAIRADILDVDDPDLSSEDALIFPRVLVASLRPRVGQRVLGVLVQGVAKPGQNAPWIIEDASTDAAAVKRAKAAIGGTAKAAPKAKAAAGASPVPF